MSGKGRFWDDSASEASDEGARESRSHKDKAWDALMSCCESIHNHLKINNWVALDEDYDKLQRTFEGAHILIAREGVPRFYIRTLVTLEDAINGVSRAAMKTFSPANAKAFNRVRANLRKNKEKFEPAIAAYRSAPDTGTLEDTYNAAATSSAGAAATGGGGARKAPAAKGKAKGGAGVAIDSDSDDEVVIAQGGIQIAKRGRLDSSSSSDSSDSSSSGSDSDSDSSSSSSSSSDSSSEAGPKGRERFVKKATGGAGGDDESEDEDWGKDDSDEDSEEEDGGIPGAKGRDRWVKRSTGVTDDKAKKDEAERLRKARAADQKARVDAKDNARAASEAAAAASTPSGGATSVTITAASLDLSKIESAGQELNDIVGKEWTQESLEIKVFQVLGERARSGVPRLVANRLSALAEISLRFGAFTAIPTIMHAISARFDLSRGREAFMERLAWKRSARDINTVLNLLDGGDGKLLRLEPVRREDIEAAVAQRAHKHAAAVAAAVAAGAASAEAAASAQAVAAAATSSGSAAELRAKDEAAGIVRAVGNLSVLIEMLADEYTKSLQHMDPHKMDYIVRISDESSLHVLADRAKRYYDKIAANAEGAGAALRGGAKIDSPAARGYLTAKDADADAKLAREGAARLALLQVENMYYKHDSVATQLRITAAASDLRGEVAALAAAAVAEAMAAARSNAVAAAADARKTALSKESSSSTAASTSSNAPPTPSRAASTSGGAAGGAASGATGTGDKKEDAETLAVQAAAQANDPRIVAEAAAALAATKAIQSGKRACATAAGIIAKAVVSSLAALEGSLLAAGAIAKSLSPNDMETLADAEAAAALASAEASGVDLGGLSTASISAATGAALVGFDSAAAIAELCGYVYRYGDARSKTRAVLLHIYHHALHDRFHAGRDLLLMSKLQDSITGTDVKVQIAFNRAMTQLGIAAFRCGLWAEAHECLADITGSGHVRELLAQGLSQARINAADRDADLDREERRRLVPYHMHINVDLADACALTAAMLLEVPNIAAAEHDNRRREISRTYRRLLDAMDGRTFVGPPESTRDVIMMAGLALAEGEWAQAVSLLTGIKAWSLWSSRGLEGVKERLTRAIKEAGLSTYLYTYSGLYDSMSLSGLSAMFDLPVRSVHAIASKLIYNNEIAAKLDQPTGCIVLHRAPPNRLQALALEFADRVADLVDFNERVLAQRTGTDRFLGGDRDRFAAGGAGDEAGRGGYRRRRFDQGKMGSAAYAGRVPVTGGGRGGRPGGRPGGRYAPSGPVAGYGAPGSAKRDYRQRGF